MEALEAIVTRRSTRNYRPDRRKMVMKGNEVTRIG